MRLNAHHQKVDELGFGKCSVPMWSGGCPAGFCDDDAYGERPPSPMRKNYCSGQMEREDGRYSGYIGGLACPGHGGPRIRTFKDGTSWCAVKPDFINLHDSDVGFGDTPEQAIEELLKGTTK